MISIKRHLDGWSDDRMETPEASPPGITGGVIAYLSLLSSVMQSSARAVPGISLDTDKKLAAVASELKALATPGDSAAPEPPVSLETANREIRKRLDDWADRAAARHETNERELGEMVSAMRHAVDSLTARDERYKQEVGHLTIRLRSITTMDDIAQIREAIVDAANSLTACVERTAEEGRESLHRLKTEVDAYRSRLSDTEKLSVLDPLTGLANRRGFEERLAFRIRSGSRFSLILIDLNGFKEVNDCLGHVGGDEVLNNVARRLRVEFPSADMVARWGGDEFAVILTCSENDARARVGRIRRRPIGQSRMMRDGKPMIIDVNAAFGVVEWNGSETGTALLARADSSMYSQKRAPVAASPIE